MAQQNVIDTVVQKPWVSFLTTITGITTNPTYPTTAPTVNSYYLQIGKVLYISMLYAQSSSTGAANGTGGYLFNLPPGFMINTAVVPLYSHPAAGPDYFSGLGNFLMNVASATAAAPVNLASGGAIAYDATHYTGVFVDSYFFFVGQDPGQTFPLATFPFITYSAMLSVPIL